MISAVGDTVGAAAEGEAEGESPAMVGALEVVVVVGPVVATGDRVVGARVGGEVTTIQEASTWSFLNTVQKPNSVVKVPS
mmetsp:Transcript_41625/g.45173  ORF Transcript_41625/g.45173 Transcript_41625/m.45173 type:complete len:80 (+) Transcript_41625:244-483(+)